MYQANFKFKKDSMARILSEKNRIKKKSII